MPAKSDLSVLTSSPLAVTADFGIVHGSNGFFGPEATVVDSVDKSPLATGLPSVEAAQPVSTSAEAQAAASRCPPVDRIRFRPLATDVTRWLDATPARSVP
nr:hypothetical protein [Rhodococcus fascians]